MKKIARIFFNKSRFTFRFNGENPLKITDVNLRLHTLSLHTITRPIHRPQRENTRETSRVPNYFDPPFC